MRQNGDLRQLAMQSDMLRCSASCILASATFPAGTPSPDAKRIEHVGMLEILASLASSPGCTTSGCWALNPKVLLRLW